MRFIPTFCMPAVLLSAAASAASFPRDTLTAFEAYGYGDNIGGLAVFTAGGNAFIGDYKLANNKEAAPVIFTPTSDAWLGSPNTTETNEPTWANYKFAIPSGSSSSHDVTFIDNDTPDVTTDKFLFYGSVIFVATSEGGMEAHWYAVPTDVEGIYALKWNDAPTAGGTVLTLKATSPSS
ncbi:hypothetical protein G7Z17_g1752 [Cylindrodendrum hubeiense]|uniref:Uncharacterized protein n=1 Tax=Cylindrodendrum hubeiense TaxID=595255 RepID=A0A9P5HJ32_9HYPO|nr:hypothetical protein G7Z17_g1752 [Cylindrodendrum hubeiense]